MNFVYPDVADVHFAYPDDQGMPNDICIIYATSGYARRTLYTLML